MTPHTASPIENTCNLCDEELEWSEATGWYCPNEVCIAR